MRGDYAVVWGTGTWGEKRQNVHVILPSKSRAIMQNDVRSIEPRPLSEQESVWIREIVQTNEEWKDADLSNTQVVAEGPCDEGLSMVLRQPEENERLGSSAGYIGRLVICTDDNCFIEIRLTYSGKRLHELFVLFVDPKHPKRTLPKSWKEVSHEAYKL